MGAGEGVQVVLAVAGIQEVVGDHGVEGDADDIDVVATEDGGVVFEVLAVFGDLRVGEQRFEEG